VVCRVHHTTWTESGAWWETGTPASLSGRAAYDEGKAHQVRWV
jgi:3D-(3,5/4)-trihydroxycyclohexane-1,2-dione acylhydrolase (decyclizing)